MKSPLTQLGTLVDEVSSWNPSRNQQDKVFTYIDLGSIDQATKVITDARKISCGNAPSRARQLVKAGDILVSTVRPNLNGVAKVADALGDATASTGFCVLRPQKDRLDGSYLFHWVKTRSFVDAMVKQATGASYPAVSDKIIFSSKLPLPPLPEQRRIAAILDKADALRAQLRAAAVKLDELLQSVFIDFFGDPVVNPKGWPIVKVGDVFTDFIGGKNVECPDSSSSPYRILKVSSVTSKVYLPEESKPAPENFIPTSESIVEKDDLLFSRANTTSLVAATAYVWDTPENMVLPDKLWKMRVADANVKTMYLWELFKNEKFRRELSKLSSGTSGSMKNIAKSKLVLFNMPLPPQSLQQRFAQIAEEIEAQKRTMQCATEKSDALFASLQQRAFSGKL